MSEFSDKVLAWFDNHGRHNLPWQKEINAYRVWVSEIMLQQTQVQTVIPYFERFMQHFPDLQALANAELDEVLHLWSGLGYYSRARNLHKTAQLVCQNHAGKMPESVEVLSQLPGIGQSTAGAIASIAYQQAAAILDGNVKRVLCRVYVIDGWPGQAATEKALWQKARDNTPSLRTGDYTQAMMDLGATLCTRTKPLCQQCPVQQDCQAYKTGTTANYPNKKPKKTLPTKHSTFLLITYKNEVLLYKRPNFGIWPGLYSLFETDNADVFCQTHFTAYQAKRFSQFRHTFSHYHLEAEVLQIALDEKPSVVMQDNHSLWVNPQHEIQLGLAAPIKKLLKQIIF